MASFRRIRPIVALAAAGLMGAAPTPPAAATTLTAGIVACIPLGHGRVQCEADAEGGTGPYTFSWSPTPSGGGGELAVIGCPIYHYRTISVVVTDANSETANDSGYFYCGDDAW
jgi:hypothetical protein